MARRVHAGEESRAMTAAAPLRVDVPGEGYHRGLISCQAACPVHTDARGYVRAIAAGQFEEAYLIARGPNPFASICGRACGAPCEAAFRRGKVPRVDADGKFVAQDRPIAIRARKRFACDQVGPEVRPTDEVLRSVQSYVPEVSADAEEMAALLQASVAGAFEPARGDSVAIIGAGPAGFAAAQHLGGEIRCGVTVGRDISFADLRREFKAIIIAVGAKSSRGLGLTGELGPRVYGGVDLLRAVALDEPLDVGREGGVVGGGNVAYDVARTVLRQIAYDTARTVARLPGTGRVHLVSLETLEEMPADTLEILGGEEEGMGRDNGWGPGGAG